MDALQRHRSLYKGTTPPWKETYRKRCVDRLRNSRSRLLDRYRQMEGSPQSSSGSSSIVQEVMEEEWSALQSEDWSALQSEEWSALQSEEWSALQSQGRRLPSLWGPHGMTEENQELKVLEEIQQELMNHESCIIEEYEENHVFEQRYMSSVVEGMEECLVICPICQRNNLNVNGFFISCTCGLYFNTKERNITADVLQRLLDLRTSEHMDQCLQNPVFFIAPNTHHSNNLMISCKVCDFLSIVM